MTQLVITPKISDKTAKFKGTIAAGEHVAVTIANGGADGEPFVTDASKLRLRVVGLCGETLTMFPMPDTNDRWGGADGVLSCELNLDTVPMLRAVPPAATVPLLFVLEDVEAKTLYFKDFCEVTHWPHRINDTTPVDMTKFLGMIEAWEEQIGKMRVEVCENADGSVTITVSDGKTGARSATIRGAKGEKGEQGAHILGGYAYDEADGKYHRIVTYTNEAGEKVPTIDTGDGGAVDNLEDGPIFVKAAGTTVPRSLSERFAVIANVLDFGAWAEGSLYRQADGSCKSLDDYCKEFYGYTDETWKSLSSTEKENKRRSALADPRLPQHHDDTPAIQAAINHVAAQGGGVVYFPYPGDINRFYRIDGPAYEWYDPKATNGNHVSTLYTKRYYDDYGGEHDLPYYNEVTGEDTEYSHRYVFGVQNIDVNESYYNQAKGEFTNLPRHGNQSYASTSSTDGTSDNEQTVANVAYKERWALKSQLYIQPNRTVTDSGSPSSSNIMLVGENPPSSLKDYRTPSGSNYWGFRPNGFYSRNVVLRSSIDVDEKVGYEDRPWSVIAAPEGTVPGQMNRVTSSCEMFSMKNLEVQVHLEFNNASNTQRLYPTMGAVNLMNVRRMHIEDCFFGLDNEVGTNYVGVTTSSRCLQKSPTTTVGLFGAIEDCAEQKIVHVTVQGFKFGIVIPEMTNANFVHISDCEYALSFLDATHVSMIDQLSTHNNRRCICALPIPRPVWIKDEFDNLPKYTNTGTGQAPEWQEVDGGATVSRWRPVRYPRPFGCEIRYEMWNRSDSNPKQSYKPQVNIRVLAHDYEHGHFTVPFVSQMRWGIWDPQDRMVGSVVYHQGYPGDVGAKLLEVVGNVAPGDSSDQNAQNYDAHHRAAAMNFASNHSYYDHRSGGENASLFRNDEFDADSNGTSGNGIETDVANWMESDWTLDPYDYVVWPQADNGGLEQNGSRKGDNTKTNNVSNGRRRISADEFYLSSALPPCPVINGVKYVAPDYGDFYPILGAMRVSAVPLKDFANLRNLSLSASNLGWSGTSVSGGAFAAAGMPTISLGFDLKSQDFYYTPEDTGQPTHTYKIYGVTQTYFKFQIKILKAGWFVFRGMIGSDSCIECCVSGRSNGGTWNMISASSVQGRNGGKVCLSVPCPAGSLLETWINGSTMSDSNAICRFVPCTAELVGRTLKLFRSDSGGGEPVFDWIALGKIAAGNTQLPASNVQEQEGAETDSNARPPRDSSEEDYDTGLGDDENGGES